MILVTKRNKKQAKPTLQDFMDTLPDNLSVDWESSGYDWKFAWESAGKPTKLEDAYFVNYVPEDASYHGSSVAVDDGTGRKRFLKAKTHKTVQKEVDWYNSDDEGAKRFRKEYNFIDNPDSDYYYYQEKDD